jgi:hypothetical protein
MKKYVYIQIKIFVLFLFIVIDFLLCENTFDSDLSIYQIILHINDITKSYLD